jgi:hypothetical protein
MKHEHSWSSQRRSGFGKIRYDYFCRTCHKKKSPAEKRLGMVLREKEKKRGERQSAALWGKKP